ncbi:MAG: hypothetical protein WCD86_25615 [Ktedonobacteraceae bacterium]
MATYHHKIANQRKNFQHKSARKLVNQYQVIVFEDLPVKNRHHSGSASPAYLIKIHHCASL